MSTIMICASSVTTVRPVLTPQQKEATVFSGLRCLGMIGAEDLDISSYYDKGTGFTEKGLRKIVSKLARENNFADPGRLNLFVELVKSDIAGKLRSGEIAKSPDSDPKSIYRTPAASSLPLISDPLARDVAHAKMAYLALGIMGHKTFSERCNSNWTYYGSAEQDMTAKFQDEFDVDLTENDQVGRLGKKTVMAIAEALEANMLRGSQGVL